jgi:hypothetical protein
VYLSRGRWAVDVIASRDGSLLRLLSPWSWQRDDAWLLRVMLLRETRVLGLPGPLRPWIGFEIARDDSGIRSVRAQTPWKRRNPVRMSG